MAQRNKPQYSLTLTSTKIRGVLVHKNDLSIKYFTLHVQLSKYNPQKRRNSFDKIKRRRIHNVMFSVRSFFTNIFMHTLSTIMLKSLFLSSQIILTYYYDKKETSHVLSRMRVYWCATQHQAWRGPHRKDSSHCCVLERVYSVVA
jgi:hypothetical protein